MTEVRAWVDESGSSHVHDPGTYVLAAAIGRLRDEEEMRRQIQRLRLPGQGKLHWRDESERRREAISSAVAVLDLQHLVVVRCGADLERPERRRRKCLERLLYELEVQAVTEVVLESRGCSQDRRDIQMLNALRGQKRVGAAVRLTHMVGRSEPMLWIPDAVCGAITSARTGTYGHQDQLRDKLKLIEI